MQTWINFWSILFWISMFCIISNINNIIRLLLFSEVIWIILYTILLVQGSINDDINLISNSIFILGFAGLEYASGILILIIFKNTNKSLNIYEQDDILHNNKNIYLNKFKF